MIFITSFPYIGPRHIRVFDYFKKKDDLTFILPAVWKMKDGKVTMKPIPKAGLNIIPARTFFFHSKYPIIRGHFKGWMPATGRLLKRLAKHGDALFTVSEPNLFMTYLNGRLAKRFGLKHAFYTWQNVAYTQRMSGVKLKFTEWLVRKNIALSRGAVCGNMKALEVLSPYLPAGFKTLVSPLSGVDTHQFRPDIAADFRQKNNLQDKILVTFIGAMDQRKGLATLLESFLDASPKESRLHLLMIGAGPMDGFVKDFISQHSLQSKVTILPWQANEELPNILCSSDIFIYASTPIGGWEEQFGYSVAEAAACQVPVISTPTGAISEKVIHGKTGLLIQPGDTIGFSQAILRLAADSELRKTMGQAGRELIVERFSQEVIAAKLENFLRTL